MLGAEFQPDLCKICLLSLRTARRCYPAGGGVFEQRDEHIRRYAELLIMRREIQVPQNAAPEIGYKQPPQQSKGIPRQIAEETGLSVDTVRRALNPPAPEHPYLLGRRAACSRNLRT